MNLDMFLHLIFVLATKQKRNCLRAPNVGSNDPRFGPINALQTYCAI